MGEHTGNFLDLKKVCLLNIVIDIVHHIRGFSTGKKNQQLQNCSGGCCLPTKGSGHLIELLFIILFFLSQCCL